MIPRMDSTCRLRGLSICFGLCVCVGEAGCARLESFRNPDRNVLGSVSKDDTYPQLARDRRSNRTQSDASETRAGQQPESRLALTSGSIDGEKRHQEPPVQVALQPPRAVPRRSPDRGASPSQPARATDSTVPAPSEKKDAPVDSSIRTTANILAESRTRMEALTSYRVHLTRQERVGETLLPAEDVILSIRRQPKAVRIEWPDGPHKGREVLYAADRDGGAMHINMADALVPVPRVSMAPDSSLALSNSRHPITDAGFDTIVSNLETASKLSQAGNPASGQFTYEGLERLPEIEHPCHRFKQVKPNGETWLVAIDSETHLPAQVMATGPNGALLERYVFRNVQTDLPDLATAAAFDPNSRWGQVPSLLQRLARAGGTEAKPADNPPR